MTNSQASAIRPKRLQTSRAWLIFAGIVVIAAAVPFCLLISQNGQTWIPKLDNLFSALKPNSELKKETPKPVKSAQTDLSKNSAIYVTFLDQASKDLLAKIEKSPTDPTLQNQLGLIYLSLGDNKAAEPCFINSVNLCKTAIAASTTTIEKYRSLDKVQEAANELVQASALSIELSAAHSNLARIYDLRGDRNHVIAELEQLNKDGILLAGLNPTKGRLKTKDGQLSPAETQSLARAETYLKQEQTKLAIDEYKSILKNNPKVVFAHERLGLIFAMRNDLPAAIEEWEAAAKLAPNSHSVQNNLGLAYMQMGLKTEAETAFRHSLALEPKSEEAALNLGEILSADGKLNEAIVVLRQSAKNNPHSARSLNNLGTFLSLSGNTNEALSTFHKAIQIDPQMASSYYGMGMALMHNKTYPAAIKAFKQALILNPKMLQAQTKIEETYRLSTHG